MTPELSNSGIPQDRTAVPVEIYRAAAAKLRAILIAPPGSTQAGREWSQARAAQQLAQIEALIARMKQDAAAWISDPRDGSDGPVTQAVKDGIARAITQAKEVGVSPPEGMTGSFSLIDPGTVAIFAQKIMSDLSKAANGMGENAKQILRTTAQLKLPESDINKILAGGVIAGKPAETIRTLREALKAVHGDTVSFPDKNGEVIHYDAGYYAKMVVVTQTRTATTVSRHRALESMDLDLVGIIGRVSASFCTAFLGQVFSLSGKSTKYPAYSSLPGGGPPFHPNCSKGTRPFVEALASDHQLTRAEGFTDSQELLGDDAAAAQRKYKDLQIQQQVKDKYPVSAVKLVGPSSSRDSETKEPQRVLPQVQPKPVKEQVAPSKPADPIVARPKPDVVAQPPSKMDELNTKLKAAREATAAAMDQLEAVRKDIVAMKDRLLNLIASGSGPRAEIDDLRKKIAAAESLVARYDRAVKRRESKE